MKEGAIPSLRRFTFLALLSAVLLISSMLLAYWLSTPGHTPGQIIITSQDIAQPVITDQENAVTQPGYRASLYDSLAHRYGKPQLLQQRYRCGAATRCHR